MRKGGKPLAPRERTAARAIVTASLLLIPITTRSQEKPEEPPRFPATVELVTVDAVVVDAKGKAVSGLTKDDFTVLENGVPQAVTRFEAVVLPSEPAPAPPVERRASF